MVCKMPYKINNVSVNNDKKIQNIIKTVAIPQNNTTTSVVMENSSTNNDDPLELKRVAGGSLIDYPPIFNVEEDSLYVRNENVIHVYSTKTGEWIKDLEKAPDTLISLQYELNNSNKLIGCTKSGDIVQWTTKSGAIESCRKLPLPNLELKSFNLLSTYSKIDSPYAIITFKTSRNWGCSIIDSYSGEELNMPVKIKLSPEGNVYVAVDTKKFHYFAIAQNGYFYVVNYKTWASRKWLNAQQRPITCICLHPEEQMLATGDQMGRVFLYRHLFTKKNIFYTSIYHWHHMPVNCVAFTATGQSFYSGGFEATLLKWSINNLNQRDFIPRLPSVIAHIVVSDDNANVAVCLADNEIQIYSQDILKCTLQNFSYVNDYISGLNCFPVGLKVNPRNNCLVLNGRGGHLQFFSTYTKSLLYNFDVVLQNRLPLESGKVLYDTEVTKVDLNVNWMVTAEVCDDQEHLPELRLKFWEYKEDQHNYKLNTRIELPHEGGIKSIKFSNKYETDNLLCATSGNDNFIKIWSLEDSDNIYKKGKCWFCIARTTYKNLPVDSISFSEDGSLLAAGYGNTLCVYNAKTLKLKTVLSSTCGYDGTSKIAQVRLGRNNLNGSRKTLNKQNCLQLFKNIIETNDQNLLKSFVNKTDKKKNKISPAKLNEQQRETLFKRILEMNELNLFKKITLYQRLGISCTLNDNNSKEKLRKNLQKNIFNAYKNKNKLWNKFNKSSDLKALYATSDYTNPNSLYIKKVNEQLTPLLNLLNLNSKAKNQILPAKNSNSINIERPIKTILPDILSPTSQSSSIKHVVFSTNEFAHFVIVCTEERLLVWNLLTLRLQNVLKISVRHITVDPLTNLFAVFTINNELFVFLPHIPMPIYNRKNMPEIYGACWVPRRYPKSQSISVDWQSVSTLYFLTTKQEIMFLASENDSDRNTSSTEVYLSQPNDNPKYSIFGAFAAYQTTDKVSNLSKKCVDFIGVPGKNAVQSLIEMPSHTMPPLNLISTNFLQAVVGSVRTKSDTESDINAQSNCLNSVDDDQIDSDDEEINSNVKVQNRKAIAAVAEQQKLQNSEIKTNTSSMKNQNIFKTILSQANDVELLF